MPHLNLGLDILDGVAGLHLKGDGLAREGLQEVAGGGRWLTEGVGGTAASGKHTAATCAASHGLACSARPAHLDEDLHGCSPSWSLQGTGVRVGVTDLRPCREGPLSGTPSRAGCSRLWAR